VECWTEANKRNLRGETLIVEGKVWSEGNFNDNTLNNAHDFTGDTPLNSPTHSPLGSPRGHSLLPDTYGWQ